MTASGSLFGQSGTPFPKRFYKNATAAPEGEGFVLQLDGRVARTPARNPLLLPTVGLAEAIAGEWAAVETLIDPREMPMTRLANSVIDGVARAAGDVQGEIIRYAGSDLLVYRASEPPELVALQRRAWDPILAWAAEVLAVALTTREGVMFVAQPPGTEARVAEALTTAIGSGAGASFRLGALHVMTTLTGSTLLALAVAHGRLEADEAWAAAHVDEDFQISRWGADDEATERRAHRWMEMRTAARVLAFSRSRESMSPL